MKTLCCSLLPCVLVLAVGCADREASEPVKAPQAVVEAAVTSLPEPAPLSVQPDPGAFEVPLREADALVDAGLETPEAIAKARELYMKALEANRDLAPGYLGLAACEMQEGYEGSFEFDHEKLARAERLARHALSLEPESARAHLMLASVLIASDDIEPGSEQLTRAETLDPGNPRHKVLRAALMLHDNNRLGAAALLREVIADGKDRTATHDATTLLGIMQMSEGFLEAAEESFGRAAEIRPGSAYSNANLALVQLGRRKIDEAIRSGERGFAADKIEELYPILAEAYALKAEETWTAGKKAEAEQWMNRLNGLGDDVPVVHLFAGVFYWKVGQASRSLELYDRATKSIRLALELDPELKPATELLKQIEMERRVRASL